MSSSLPESKVLQIEPWLLHITEISRLPNVACKVSGVISYCAPGQVTLEAVRPYVEHCLEQFGWDRVVWGSDWPVCTIMSDLHTWVQVTKQLIADEGDQRKLLHGNALRIYRANR